MRLYRVLAFAAGLLVFAAPAAAQEPDTAALRRRAEREMGSDINQDQILQQLQASGMTRSQMRARLQAMGYDPSLADEYFDAIENDEEAPTDPPSADLIRAMRRLGVETVADSLTFADSLLLDSIARDSLLLVLDSLLADSARMDSLRREQAMPIFGMELFSTPGSQFAPTTWGPVGPDYQIGPGDELFLILTGDVEVAHELTVTREGFVVIPDVGQVSVAGLTIGQLEQRLYGRLGAVYSGIERGPGATTQFQVSLGQLRNNQVYLVGEVQRPGAYQVSAVATVFNALYHGRGPNRNGSFRNVQVRRGGRLVGTVDIYEYLLSGGSENDIRLQNGDRVFVPLAGPRVSIEGQVRRQARYELKPGETLADLLVFAGGFRPGAVGRITIDRIVPIDERRPGIDRVIVDAPVRDLAALDTTVLQDGDRITVYSVGDERRELVTITGDVRREGVYQWRPGMTLGELIESAEGLGDAAYRQRAQIYRMDDQTWRRSMIPVTLETDAEGRFLGSSVRLADRDSVVIYSRALLATTDSVEITGFVKVPGVYPLAEGMTTQDLILAAGGFVRGADVTEAEIARLPDPFERTDTTAVVYRVPLATSASAEEAARVGADRMIPEWTAESGAPLQPDDKVHIGRAAGYEPPRRVAITGEVERPGVYVLTSREERVSDLIARAGGLTEEAYIDGFQLMRDSMLVGTDLAEVLRDREHSDNIPLFDGDSIHVPRFDGTVHVTGAVVFETRALFVPGADLGYYIEQAGGYARNADRRRTSVTYQNGERETVNRFLWMSFEPDAKPGSMIFVPPAPHDTGEIDWGAIINRTTAVLGTLATLIFAYTQISG